jgi:N-methylhydantoinase A
MSRIVAVDVGGTFTDVVAVEDGAIATAKVPTIVDASDVSVLEGARELGVGRAAIFNLASTAGLNAILTRQLPKVAFLTTAGHRDLLDHGSMIRPLEALTDPGWRRNFGDARGRPLVPRYLRRGIRERMTAAGDPIVPLDEPETRRELELLRTLSVRAVAICLLHAYRNDAHERRVRELVHEVLGDVPVSISSETAPLIREYPRASTTVVDVLMKVLYGEYTERLERGLAATGFSGQFNYADCSANLLPHDYAAERPYQLVLGGPAGAAVAAAHFGAAIGDANLLCADVGGTSADMSVVVDGVPWSSSAFEIEHDMVVSAPTINIVTLGAGGGSIIDATPEGDIATGPDSAGAQPGPACYGDGGDRPTVTDAAAMIGILSADAFLGGRKVLRTDLALKAFERLDTPLGISERVRYGWQMAVNHIAEGLVNIGIRRGIDSRDFSLLACGAAGPMLLPFLLDQLPIRRVVVPPYPGLFSALGLVSTDRVYSDHRGQYLVLGPHAAPAVDALYQTMEERLIASIPDAADARVVRTFDARLYGQSWETPLVEAPEGRIDEAAITTMIDNFRRAYEEVNGLAFAQIPVEAVTFRVQAIQPAEKLAYREVEPGTVTPRPSGEIVLEHLYDAPCPAFEYRRQDLGRGDEIHGPAVIREPTSTTVVPAGRAATFGTFGEITIS